MVDPSLAEVPTARAWAGLRPWASFDLPVLGPVLRRGGAFFMRRSFKGNALYSVVFKEYMAQLIDQGALIGLLGRRALRNDDCRDLCRQGLGLAIDDGPFLPILLVRLGDGVEIDIRRKAAHRLEFVPHLHPVELEQIEGELAEKAVDGGLWVLRPETIGYAVIRAIESVADRSDIRKDVGVIELQVVEHGNRWPVVHEL